VSEPAKSPDRMIVTLSVSDLEQIVEAAVERSLEKRKPAKLMFSTAEAAEMLGVPDSWLADRARKGEIPHRMMGHYRLFSLQDIEQIMLNSASACDTVRASQKGGATNGKEKEKPSGGCIGSQGRSQGQGRGQGQG
jgi:excisionase family DNA binding protein